MQRLIRYLDSNSGFSKYFFNTSWVLLEKVIRILASLFVGIWVARYLGPDRYGILGYCLSVVGILTALSTFGLNRIIVRNIVKNQDDEAAILGTSLIIQTFGSIILLGLLFAYNSYSEETETIKLIILILGAQTFFQSFQIIDSYFQSRVQSKYVVFANVISLLISNLLKIVLILVNASLLHFVLIILLESILLAICLIYFYQRKSTVGITKWKFNNSLMKELLGDSWPLILNGIIVSIYMRIDQVMIKQFINEEAVGLYAAAARLSESFYFLPIAITNSLYPAIVSAKKTDELIYRSRLQSLYDLMVWMALGIIIPITLLNKTIILVLYGQAYSGSAEVLGIHAWTALFVFLGVARGGWIITENLQRYSSLYLTAGMIANIALNLYCIPKFGIEGAAYATLFSQGISVWIAPMFFRKTRLFSVMITKSFLLYPLVLKFIKKDEKLF